MTAPAIDELTVIVTFHDLRDVTPANLTSLHRSAGARVRFLLVDDGSTDGTTDLLRAAARTLPRAELLALPTCGGVSAARELAMDQVATRWFTFLDGDDWVAPAYFPTLLEEVAASGVDWVRTDYVEATGRDRRLVRIPEPARDGRMGSPRASLLRTRTSSVDVPQAWTSVYHRRLRDEGIVSFDPALRTAEDRPVAWRLHLREARFTVARTVGVFYRRDITSSLTRVGDERQLDYIPAMRQIRDEVAADAEADRLMGKVVQTWIGLTVWQWRHRHRLPLRLRHRFVREADALLTEAPPELLAEALDRLPESPRQMVGALHRQARVLEVPGVTR